MLCKQISDVLHVTSEAGIHELTISRFSSFFLGANPSSRKVVINWMVQTSPAFMLQAYARRKDADLAHYPPAVLAAQPPNTHRLDADLFDGLAKGTFRDGASCAGHCAARRIAGSARVVPYGA